MTQEYEALAARVEAAAGPDRELDALIQMATSAPEPSLDPAKVKAILMNFAPAYTASLDAATTVFSPDTMYRSGHDGAGPDPSLFYCEAITAAPECRRVRAVAVSEACARIAAALRAHLIKDQADGEMGG